MNGSPVVIAAVPKSRYIAIAVFSAQSLIYYKICSVVSRQQNRLLKTSGLIEYFVRRYQPQLLAIESLIYAQQQTSGLLALSEEIAKSAQRAGIEVDFYSPVDVRSSLFSDKRGNKFQAAYKLIELYPELVPYLNPTNSNPQQYGLLLFNAVALGLYAVRTLQHKRTL